MKKLLLFYLTILLAALPADAQEQPVIVSAQWVHENLQDPKMVIVQVNGLQLDYEAEHISGARFLWPDWLAANSPQGTFNPPGESTLTQVLQQLGINKDSKVVLCHTKSDISVTARMFLTMEYAGLKGKVFFLNGGLEAWKKAGYPVTSAIPVVKKGNFKAAIEPVIVDRNYVLQSMQNPETVIVDARMKRFYDGDPTGYPRDGHITGAKNLPYTDLFDSTNFIKPGSDLARYFETVVPAKENEIITYCFIGQTASVIYLTGRSAGYNVKLYDGSMQEWSRLNSLPIEKTKKE